MTIKQAYSKIKAMFSEKGFDAPDFEALSLINYVTGFDRHSLIAHGENKLENSKEDFLFSLVQKRLSHIPLQYILGEWSFYGFDFAVGEGVLIPRDDTEVVVNLCLDFLKNRTDKKVIDLCAGSGAISVVLSKLADADVTAVELSEKAFEYLDKNIRSNNADINAVKGDILSCYADFDDEKYDLIVSNPPYIKSEDIPTLQDEVQFEPEMALDGGVSGFDFYESIIENWSANLKDGGALAFELGENQAEYVSALMKEKGFVNIRTELDLGGVRRAIIGTIMKK